MADIVNVLTLDGQNLIAASINSKVLKFTQVKVGTSCWTGSDLERLASQTGAVMRDGTLPGTCSIAGKTSNNGIMTVIAAYKNDGYTG